MPLHRLYGKQPESHLHGVSPESPCGSEAVGVTAELEPCNAEPQSQQKRSETESNSSSSSSSDESEPSVAVQGSQSDTSDAPALPCARGRVAMVTWSCPRTFKPTLELRKASGVLLPEDLSRQEFGKALISSLRVMGLYGALKYLVIAREFHKKYMPNGERAVHYHAVLCMKSPFAHKGLSDHLAKQHCIRAWFSFNLLFA